MFQENVCIKDGWWILIVVLVTSGTFVFVACKSSVSWLFTLQ